MTRNMRLLASASVLAATAVAASPAFAAGTAAGTTVTNSVTLDYKVGGIDQVQISASDTFTVDRKVILAVTETSNTPTSVTPGQTAAVTAFSVSNSSNAPLDFALSASQLNGGTAPHNGKTDNFNVVNLKVYADSNANSSYDPGTDQETSYLDQVPADTSRTVFIVADIPVGRANNDVAAVRLTATAAEATASGSLGATLTQTTGANTAGVDTVFGDGDTGGNVARDGIHFAEDDYVVSAASLTATKTSRVISDPLNVTTNPKMIPGAVVEYCIAVANAATSGATASAINITDEVPAQTTYDPSFGVKVNGAVNAGTCTAGTGNGSYANGIVSGSLADIVAGDAKTLVFRVIVK